MGNDFEPSIPLKNLTKNNYIGRFISVLFIYLQETRYNILNYYHVGQEKK